MAILSFTIVGGQLRFGRSITFLVAGASSAADGCQIQILNYCGISLASKINHFQYSGLGI
jgi:hypothetical protein